MPPELNRILRTIKELDLKSEGERRPPHCKPGQPISAFP